MLTSLISDNDILSVISCIFSLSAIIIDKKKHPLQDAFSIYITTGLFYFQYIQFDNRH